jgi:hypothetical protein
MIVAREGLIMPQIVGSSSVLSHSDHLSEKWETLHPDGALHRTVANALIKRTSKKPLAPGCAECETTLLL